MLTFLLLILRLRLVTLYNYTINVFFSVLMSREFLKWTYNIKHPLERNAKIASN